MLDPEIEEGCIEYKRYIIDKDDKRLEELASQMKWRLAEGNGLCVYYLGVNDDGSIYKLTNLMIKESFKNIKLITKKINCKLQKVTKIKDNDKVYFKLEIISDDFMGEAKRILLLGDTKVGKTTFLAYLINDKLFNNSRIFILNHKHEIESGKTSSFNYKYINYKDIKFVFLDTPGDIEYRKTLNKIFLSTNPDLILYFEKDKWKHKNLYYQYAINNNIKWINLNLYSNENKLPEINMNNPPKKEVILNFLRNNLKEKKLVKSNNSITEFLILETYPHPDLGWILSGYLKEGKIKINDELILHTNLKNKVIVRSIHLDSKPIDYLKKNRIASLCVYGINDLNFRPKYGRLMNINFFRKNVIRIKWIYINETILENMIGYIENKSVRIIKIGRKNNLIIYNVVSKFIINFMNKLFFCKNGFGRII